MLPANGTHAAILQIPSFGRYSVAVSSPQGVALQLVDRMAGPGDVAGAPGGSDGRVDAFLERGSYQIRVIADARGAGKATLSVTASTELQQNPLQLVENKPVVAQLGDHQQRSWWIVVPSRGTYNFEAGGRYLDELRLWRDGSWMVNAAPISGESDADPERPLALRQLSATLEPGVYRLTAYGGAGLPWAGGGTDAPFMLRWGIPSLSDASRTEETASVLGIDRFLIPGTAVLARLVIDHPEDAAIAAQVYDPGSVFDQSQANSGTIDKTSRDPVAEVALSGASAGQQYELTVNVKPGEKYRLEVLNQTDNGNPSISPEGAFVPGSSSVSVQGGGDALLAVTLAGNPDDEIDPGFLLVDDGPSPQIVASSAIDLDSALPWRRRFNLQDNEQTYVYTSKNVDLEVDGAGVNAAFVVSRFLPDADPDVVVPLPKPSGGIWPLTAGFYVLTAIPQANGRGILTMSMQEAGTAPAKAESPRLPAAFFTGVALDSVNGDTLYSSLVNGDGYGLRQVGLPASLDAPICFELGAGQTVRFPITVSENAQISVADEGGKALGFALDGNASTGAAQVQAGQHDFSITGPGPGVREVTLSETPFRLLTATPLPAIPDNETAAANLPVVQPGAPTYVDLAQGQAMTFQVPVSADALYRFETTGLIETAGAIRTRVNPDLMDAEGNGVGRNFLLQPYLREGDYQLTVTAQGQTAGHAGVSVTAAPLVDEGALAPGRAARMTLEPGEAALYHFHVPAEGTYHLFTLGLGHQFAMRLEDADGWPLMAPGGNADVTMDFVPGDYRMILLPGTVENRAVTMLQPVLPPVAYAGHGPFAAMLGSPMANRWMEPASGQPRAPDVWKFSLPAAASVSISLDGGMKGVLALGGAQVAVVSGSWSGALGAGDYVLSAMSAVPDNRVDYHLEIDTTELLAGQSRDVQAPATVPVSLGGGQVEISSFGDQDVRAVLYDAAGNEVAENDDRDNDWNFLITGRFPAGKYALEVDPVGMDNAETTVSITAPEVVTDKALRAGVSDVFADGLVHVMAAPAVADGGLLLVGAQSAAPVGLTLEEADDRGWREIASDSGIAAYVAVPAGGGTYRIRAWAEDHGASPVSVTAVGVTDAGAALAPVAVGGQRLQVAKVAVAQQAVLEPVGGGDSLQWSDTDGVAVAHDPSGSILATGKSLWLVDAKPETVNLQPADLLTGAVRLTLKAGQKVALPLPSPESGKLAIWTAQAQGGQPGVGVNEAGDPTQVMAVGPKNGLFSSAVAFQSPDLNAPVLNIWQAGAAVDALPVRVTRTVMGFAGFVKIKAGENDGTVPGMSAVQAGFGMGWKRFTLNLPAGMVAVLENGDEPQAMVLGNGVTPDVVEAPADSVMLLNPSAGAAPYSVTMQPEAGPGLVLQPGGLLTPFSATAAVLHLSVTGGKVMPLRVAGAALGLTVVGADGMVREGDGALAGPGAQVLVNVAPGLAVVAQDFNGATNQIGPVVAVPGSVALRGAAMVLNVPAAGARLVHFETDTPVILRQAGAPEVFPAGASLNLFQPKGVALALEVLPVSGVLSGTARFDAVGAIPISDGPGPKILAGPGESKLFTFSVDAARRIGVGVRGSVDDASVRLMASDGTVLGTGVIAMQKLAPGTYFLAADVPADGAAAVIQPALVGLTLPDDGPPADVQENYERLGK